MSRGGDGLDSLRNGARLARRGRQRRSGNARRSDIAWIRRIFDRFIAMLTPREPSPRFLAGFFAFALLMFGLAIYIGQTGVEPVMAAADEALEPIVSAAEGVLN